MKLKNVLVIGLTLLILLVSYVWFFVYNKEHTNYATEKPHFEGHADSLHITVLANQDEFQDLYLNKAVLLHGIVNETGEKYFKIGEGLMCTMDEEYLDRMPEIGDEVRVQGRIVGLSEDILTGEMHCTLDQCIIIEN